MYKGLALLLPAALAGCGVLSPVMRSDVLDYSEVIEETSDKFLLRNVLEARDDAPVHFVELPKITGTLQATASLPGAVQFSGRAVNAGTGIIYDTLTPTIGVQSSPSFEVDNLATKEFVTGLSLPIDPRFVKYWIDRGLDIRIILLLFFSSARITDTCEGATDACKPGVITVHNSPREAANFIVRCKANAPADECHARTGFELYLTLIDSMKTNFVAHGYKEKSLIAQGVTLNPHDISDFDPKMYELELSGDHKSYTIYSTLSEQKMALCLVYGSSVIAPGNLLGNACTDDEVIKKGSAEGKKAKSEKLDKLPVLLPAGQEQTLLRPCGTSSQEADFCQLLRRFLRDSSRPDNDRFTLELVPRSTAEMVRFLGDLLYYQDHSAIRDAHHNIPVTLGFDRDCANAGPGAADGTECLRKQGGWLFRTNGNNGEPRFALRYRNVRYTIAENDPNDHSLEVFAVVNQLVNLNKSASSFQTTPTIRVIP